MFCDRCGAELQATQRFCGSCGKPVGVATLPASTQGRVGRHLQILAVLWFAASALNLICGAVLMILGNTLFHRMGPIPNIGPAHGFLQGLFSLLGAIFLAKALAGFAAGWGLLQRESWARPLTLVLGVISLINMPLGTALGIYTLWVLLGAGADEEYQRLAQAA